MKTRNCPVCDSYPIMETHPLWRDYGYTIHGYKDCYDFTMKCSNDNCPCSLIRLSSSTINQNADTARDRVVEKWNEYVLNVEKIMKENK